MKHFVLLKMYNTCKYVFLISFFVSIQLARVDTESKTNTIRVLRIILQMKSWINTSNIESNISHQNIFIDGQLRKFNDIVKETSVIDETNMEQISSLMYIALECKCSETIRKVLKRKIDLDVSVNGINTIILKIISILFDFINVAPNTISIEPGFLTTSLLLNLQMNNLKTFKKSHPTNDDNTMHTLKLMKFQMINLIERFTIENCSVDNINKDLEHGSSEQEYDYINDLLDNTGLLSTSFLDIYQSRDKSQKNCTILTIIINQVLKKLDPILLIEESFSIQMQTIQNDIELILVYMELILDSIVKMIYTSILKTLIFFEICQKEKKKTSLQLTINDWNARDLVMIYDEITQLLSLLKFPSVIIHQVEIASKIVKDTINNKNILDLKIIRIITKEKLNALEKKNRSGLKLIWVRTNGSKFILSDFLTVITSIDEFKYFNQIYKLLQSGPVEYDLSQTALNKMRDYQLQFVGNIAPKICDEMASMYAHCYDIQTNIEACLKDPVSLEKLKNPFLLTLRIFDDIGRKSLNGKDENLNTILSWIHRYLNNNLVYFTHNTEKLKRIVFTITNLIDKYQVHNCNLSSHRISMYATFTNDQKILLKLLKYSETENNMTYELNVLETVFENNTSTEESLKYMSIQKHIEVLKKMQSSAFYWSGTLQTINEIYVDKTQNMFNFSSHTKYMNTLHKWIISELFDTIVNTLKHLLKDNYLVDHDRFITKYVKELSSVNFPEYVLPIINAIKSAKNFYYPTNIIGFQVLLEDHLEQYSASLKKPCMTDDALYVYKNKLNTIFDVLMKIYNEKSNIKINLKTNSKKRKPILKKKYYRSPFRSTGK